MHMRREVEPEHGAQLVPRRHCRGRCGFACPLRIHVRRLVTWSEQPTGAETVLTGLDLMCLVSYLPEITSHAHEQASAVLAAASQ